MKITIVQKQTRLACMNPITYENLVEIFEGKDLCLLLNKYNGSIKVQISKDHHKVFSKEEWLSYEVDGYTSNKKGVKSKS